MPHKYQHNCKKRPYNVSLLCLLSKYIKLIAALAPRAERQLWFVPAGAANQRMTQSSPPRMQNEHTTELLREWAELARWYGDFFCRMGKFGVGCTSTIHQQLAVCADISHPTEKSPTQAIRQDGKKERKAQRVSHR